MVRLERAHHRNLVVYRYGNFSIHRNKKTSVEKEKSEATTNIPIAHTHIITKYC